MKVKFLGVHNTASLNSHYSCFLIDGVLGVDAGNIASSLTFDEQRKVEAVLLSHAHYDHIREIPTLAFNTVTTGKAIKVFGLKETLEILSARFSDGKIYPDFTRGSRRFEHPALELREIRTLEEFAIGTYKVLPVKIPHIASSVGFEISSGSSRLFYTSDTGQGLDKIWQYVSPDVLITELTLPDRLKDFAVESQHLSASLLLQELDAFQRQKGYLPKVLATHRNPEFEAEIEQDIRLVFKDYNLSISLAAEGEEIIV